MDKATRVLIIDDDPDFQEIHKTVLEGGGYEVEQAFSGEEGMRQALANPPDLVLLDLMMEHADTGFVVARKLRSHPATSAVPLLLLTAVMRDMGMKFDLDSNAEKSWIKADMLIHKPIAGSELLARVKSVLDRRHGD